FQRARLDVEYPHAGMAIVLVGDAAVVLVLLALLAGVGLRLLHQQRDAPAVGRPPGRAGRVLAVGELLRPAAAAPQPRDLGCAVAIGEKRDRRTVGRPSG